MARTSTGELTAAGAWFKSSYSDGTGNNCIEVADLGVAVGVRDSKDLSRPAFVVRREAFAGFASFAAVQAV
ncbi:hypothetical protein GCM10023347_50910 [Streptomyces chumphonensis]|uniref:DUF397 domain-containing protein n=1 Tax=Streptomyces chumphonensis TaxID=1214925 RepID=A0A927F3E6_9ACTN|nr:DUF397 domain-containing protein [Streptomyces chumphonensis]MBD3933454.1 DUF397 domain-containing protein [Streptomyces chumphonensis]